MNSNGPQISERLDWEGMIDGQTALLIGVVLATVSAWLLWRERQAVGRGWAGVFWLLRVVVFALALWMLAGPTQQRVKRISTTQSVAIFADASDSMSVVDPPDATEAVRWALAIKGKPYDDPLIRCDMLAVALGSASSDCQRFAQALDEHRPTKHLSSLATAILQTIERASTHASALVDELHRDATDMAERASRIAALVDGPVKESLTTIKQELDSNSLATGDDFFVRLDQLTEGVKSAHRRTQIFADELAQHRAEHSAGEDSEIAALTRREKAGRALDALESQLSETLEKHVRIDRFRFDQTSMPVTVESGWYHSLQIPLDAASGQTITNDDVATSEDASSQAAAPATNLSAVFEQLANQRADASTRLAVLISDGRHNDADAPPPQETAAKLAGVPIYVVPIGNSVLQRDVMLHRVEAPSTVAEKDSAIIDVIVTGFDCEGLSAAAVLRHEGREVDRQPIEFSGNRGDLRVRFTVPAKELGWQEYIVEVEPVDDETSTANNYLSVSFEVVRDRVRVLLADGIARWEYRYLNQLFRRDQHVEFDELLFFPRLHGTGKLANRPEFPRHVDDWARYDVVVLGDVSSRQLSAKSQQALVEFVRVRGGNLLVVAGQNSMPADFATQPLIELLPVDRSNSIIPQQGYSLRLTDEGRFHSALLIADSAEESRRVWQSVYERLPVFGLSEYSRPKSTARTLIEAFAEAAGDVRATENSTVEHAFLCWHRVGAGRVAYLAAPETYRLRFRRGDQFHHRFWGQFLRWITAANSGAGTDVVRLQTDRTRYKEGESVEVTVWLKDTSGRPLANEEVEVEARMFNDDTRSVELKPDSDVAGRYFGTLSNLPPGAHQLAVKGKVAEQLLAQTDKRNEPKTTIIVTAGDSIEMLNTYCNRPLLEQIAQITGGQVIPPTAIGEVLKLVSFTPDVNETIQRTPLWNRWYNLFIVLGCLFTEWIVRKAKGLV